MIRTILVDDEQRGLTSLKKMLEQNCHEVEVVAQCLDADTAKSKMKECRPDLVFLDISMPGKSGFDLLNELESIPFEIIFVTAHNEYSLNAFKYSAVDYLLKPVDEDKLTEAVKRVGKRLQTNASGHQIETFLYNLQKIQSPHEMKVCIPGMKGFQVISISEIIYCEAESSYTIFHLQNGQHIIASKTLIEYEELLKDTTFCRIHKSFLVNLIHVKEYHKGEGGTVHLTNNKEVEVSRRKKEVFLSRMKELYKF